MQNFLYNEEEMAKKVFTNGFTDNYDRREVLLYAKYLRHVLGYGDVKIKKKIIEFCSKTPLFNPVTESAQIKFYVKNSKKKFFVKTSVFITVSEIQKAKQVKNFDAQKVYLALLVLAKRNSFTSIPLSLFTEIKRIANVSCTSVELSGLFHLLYKHSLLYPVVIEKNGKTEGYQKLLHVDFDGVPEISLTKDKELYELGKTYEKYCGGHLLYCVECGSEFIRNSNRRIEKYCSIH